MNLFTNTKIIYFLEYTILIFQILVAFTITTRVRERIKICLYRDPELISTANSVLDMLLIFGTNYKIPLNIKNAASLQSFTKDFKEYLITSEA